MTGTQSVTKATVGNRRKHRDLLCGFTAALFHHCLCRYRNFRTFASPRPAQFSCLTLDPSGEVVCAGSHDTFEVYVWSVQTGRLLEVRRLCMLWDRLTGCYMLTVF